MGESGDRELDWGGGGVGGREITYPAPFAPPLDVHSPHPTLYLVNSGALLILPLSLFSQLKQKQIRGPSGERNLLIHPPKRVGFSCFFFLNQDPSMSGFQKRGLFKNGSYSAENRRVGTPILKKIKIKGKTKGFPDGPLTMHGGYRW